MMGRAVPEMMRVRPGNNGSVRTLQNGAGRVVLLMSRVLRLLVQSWMLVSGIAVESRRCRTWMINPGRRTWVITRAGWWIRFTRMNNHDKQGHE
eukprot:g10804.t1